MTSPTTPPPGDMRVYFAAERTLLAWVRTGLAMMGFGFVVARFGFFLRELTAARGMPVQASGGTSLWVGTALVVLGVMICVLAAVRHLSFTRRFDTGVPLHRPRSWMAMTASLVLAFIGAVLAGYLILLPRT